MLSVSFEGKKKGILLPRPKTINQSNQAITNISQKLYETERKDMKIHNISFPFHSFGSEERHGNTVDKILRTKKIKGELAKNDKVKFLRLV